MKKHLTKIAFVATLALASLQVSAQSRGTESLKTASEATVSSFFSDVLSDIKTGFDTFFSRHAVQGSCVDGIRESWQETWYGSYIPGTLVQTPC